MSSQPNYSAMLTFTAQELAELIEAIDYAETAMPNPVSFRRKLVKARDDITRWQKTLG